MDRSQNGWPVLTREQLMWFSASGSRFAAANADVAFIAGCLIEAFNTNVESIAGPVLDDWSYAVRPERGQTSGYSNHASATAWDMNATKHPRGVRGTFSKTQVIAIRQILSGLRDDQSNRVIRWGGDFSTVVDEMHFEINATPVQVKQAAARIRARRPQPQETQMDWHEEHTYTKADAVALGHPELEGKSYAANVMLRGYTPAMSRLRREMIAHFAALTEVLTSLVVEKGGLTAEQATAAAEAGARAALDELGHDLIDPDA